MTLQSFINRIFETENLTRSQEDDDSVIILDNPAVAQQYLDEFNRVNAIAKDPKPSEIKCP